MEKPNESLNFNKEKEMSNKEKEQTKEEIEVSLKEAFEKFLVIDLVIENSTGLTPAPDCLVEDINGDDLLLTYINERGELGEVIPVSLNRVKNVLLKEPYQPKE